MNACERSPCTSAPSASTASRTRSRSSAARDSRMRAGSSSFAPSPSPSSRSPLAAKHLSCVDPRVQRFGRRRGRLQAMPAVPQERLDPAAGLLVIRAWPVHPFRGRRLGFRGPRLHRPADGFGQLVAPQSLRPLHELRRPRHVAWVDPQSPRLRFMARGRFAEPLPLVEPEALRDPPERGRDPPDEARVLFGAWVARRSAR